MLSALDNSSLRLYNKNVCTVPRIQIVQQFTLYKIRIVNEVLLRYLRI